jgi:hypothetical protein
MKKWSWLGFVPNALINLAAVLIIGAMSVAILGLDIDYLLTWSFYVTSAILFIIFTASHWSAYDARVKKLRRDKDKVEELKRYETDIQKTTRSVEWMQHRGEFIHERNQTAKKEEWIRHIQNRMTKLTNKAKERDRLIEIAQVTQFQRETLTEDALQALQQAFDDARGKNTYCKRKRAYASKIEPKWIAENIDKIRIRYDEIDTQFIETGRIVRGINKSKADARGKYFKDNAGNRLLFLLLTTAISAFAIESFQLGMTWAQSIVLALRILNLTMNVVMGTAYGDDFYKDVDEFNVQSRLSICGEFKQYGLAKGFLTKEKTVS